MSRLLGGRNATRSHRHNGSGCVSLVPSNTPLQARRQRIRTLHERTDGIVLRYLLEGVAALSNIQAAVASGYIRHHAADSRL
jgi:hypothetical protein